MQLILPCTNYEKSYQAYIQELGDEERYPFPLDFDHDDFPAMLTRIESFRCGVDLPDGFVAATTYWLIDGNEIVGVTNLRHYLNDRIRHAGGHIGLGIRPSYRGKGLGTLLMKLSVAKAAKMGIEQLHIHCHKHNQASARMIRANGGTLDSEIQDDGEIIQRFIIQAR